MSEVMSTPGNLSDHAIVVPVASVQKPRKIRRVADDDDDEFDETRSVDSDDAGSLVEFVVNDESGEESDDGASVESEPPRTMEEERERDLDGIDTNNIVVGKRIRRPTQFYEQSVFNTSEYRRMMLDDVPDDEMHALETSSDDSGDDVDDPDVN